MEKIKILFFTNILGPGGDAKVLIDLANNMDKNKYDITILTIKKNGVRNSEIASHIKYKSICRWNKSFLNNVTQKLVHSVIPSRMIYRWFIKRNYDYEIAFLEGLPTKIISSGSSRAIKYAWVHNDMYNNFSGHENLFANFRDYIEAYKRFDKIICVSNETMEGFIKKFGISDNVDVVYNVCNDKKILELSTEDCIEIEESKYNIIAVGRLCKQKGFLRLLKVHKKIIMDGISHHLYILGEGEERRNLEKYINDNSLDASVTLLGYQSNPYKYMKKCDLYVCSSIAEGFSLTVAEALIMGIPVVSTKVAGPCELLGDGKYGLLVENSEEGLYEGIKSILYDKEKYSYYKKQAKEQAKYFKMENSIKVYYSLFK